MAVGFAMIASYLLSSTLVPVFSTWLMKEAHRGEERGRLRSMYNRYAGGVVKTDDPDSMKAAYGGFLKERRKRKPRDLIPAMYGDAKQTPLKAHVPPDGSLKFELRSKGG